MLAFEVKSIHFIALAVIVVSMMELTYGLTTQRVLHLENIMLFIRSKFVPGAKSSYDCSLYRSSRPSSVHIDTDSNSVTLHTTCLTLSVTIFYRPLFVNFFCVFINHLEKSL